MYSNDVKGFPRPPHLLTDPSWLGINLSIGPMLGFEMLVLDRCIPTCQQQSLASVRPFAYQLIREKQNNNQTHDFHVHATDL